MIFQLDKSEFIQFTSSNKTTVLDIREPEETSLGVLPGATVRPKSQFEAWVKEFSPDQQVAMYCRSGGRVKALADEMEKRGFKNLVLAVGYGFEELNKQIELEKAFKENSASEAQIFHQIFDPSSSTYTYIVGDRKTKEVLVLDSIHEHYEFYLDFFERNGYKPKLLLETHMHADHVSCVAPLAKSFPEARFHAHPESGLEIPFEALKNGETLQIGEQSLKVMFTPGHTAADVCFVFDNRLLFSGDCMFINSCGRTDFQGGSAEAMFRSLHSLCTLGNEMLVYPGHNYDGLYVSSIGQELKNNPLLKLTKEKFIETLNGWNLPRPARIDFALPANLKGGIWSDSPLVKGGLHEAP